MNIILLKKYKFDVKNELKCLFRELNIEANVSDSVNCFYITPDEQYGDIISMIDKNADYTKTDSSIGVGKTITRETGKSEIVIRDDMVISALLDYIKFKLNILLWCKKAKRGLFTLIHEIGHALDFQNNMEHNKLNNSLKRPFNASETDNYYFPIILSEIGANINLRKILPKHFNLLLHEEDRCLYEHRKVHEFIYKLQSQTYISEDEKIIFQGVVWYIFYQGQELFISKMENEKYISSYFGDLFPFFSKTQFYAYLWELILSYPTWTKDEPNKLKSYFYDFLGVYGISLNTKQDTFLIK